MFEDNTVFVIGAGASQEFGMPVGWDLLKEIRDNSFFQFDLGSVPNKGNGKIYRAVQERHGNDSEMMKKVFEAFSEIHRGVDTAGSINEFINRYSDDPIVAEIGKLQIAHAIIRAETRSHLVPKQGKEADGINWDRVENTWITPFGRALFDGVRATQIETIGNNISIICFNYDRCIEHYLEYAIQRAYRGVDRKTARAIVKNINIIHPYGSIGNINQISFGHPLDQADLYHVTKNLITWSESVEDEDMVADIKEAIRDARSIVFMGFAFANQNMKLLDADVGERLSYYKNVYSTGYGLTNDVEFKLRQKITRLYSTNSIDGQSHERIKIMYDMKCNEFLKKHLLNFVV